MYKKVAREVIKGLEEIVGDGLLCDPEKMYDYMGDEYADPSIKEAPEVVVKPKNTGEVAAILKLANRENIPVTPRGGGTGLCGGCVPLHGGIVLSLENMNKILEIDKENMLAVVEAGVTLGDFYAEVEKANFFFPPHPGEEGAQIGGLISTNASGSRAVKYGGIRNYVRGLELVLPQGGIINMGGKFIKNSTGYSLLNLLVGSEGTLGIITRAIISLLPKSPVMYTLIVPYDSLDDAIMSVPEIRNKVLPMAVEFIESDVIPPTEDLLNKKWPCKGRAYLMIIVDGTSEKEVLGISENIADICMKHNVRSIDEIAIADTKERQRDVLEIRSNIYSALKRGVIEILDIAVPPARIGEYVAKIHEISKKYDIWLPTYGHAADGNVHTHLMKVGIKDGKLDDVEIEGWRDKYPPARRELHMEAKKLEGIVSGEHGIGLSKMEYLPVFVDRAQIELMKGIKELFDPNNILNPGKIFEIP